MNSKKLSKPKRARNALLYIAILIFCIIFSITAPGFFTWDNLKAILQSMAIVCVMGIGATFVLTIGEIDISTGALLSVGPCILAVMLRQGLPLLLCILVGVVAVLLLGALSGILNSLVGMPSFIATLGVSGIAMGFTRIVTKNIPVAVTSDRILNLFGREIGGLPRVILWMLMLLIAAYFILHKTRFGRNLHCIGDNREAALMYGVNIPLNIIFAFVVCAAFIFFAGMMEVCRSSYVSAGVGESLVLNSIVASVIGGTAVSGGRGNIPGTFTGAFFITVISNGLFLLAVNPFITNITIGAVILFVLTTKGIMDQREQALGQT